MARFFLAWRHLCFYKFRSLILITCVACTAYLPLAVNLLVSRGEAAFVQRAEATPRLLGADGSRLDLTLHALHFQAEFDILQHCSVGKQGKTLKHH